MLHDHTVVIPSEVEESLEKMTKLGSAGASPALFGALAEKLPMVSREARDTVGGAPALPNFVIRH
jgi:hypothetical protein